MLSPAYKCQSFQINFTQNATENSMMDGKMVGLLQGDTGGYCHYCFCTKADANDPVVIRRGFVIEKTVAEMSDVWKLIEDGSF